MNAILSKLKSWSAWFIAAVIATAAVVLGIVGVSWVRENQRKSDWLSTAIDKRKATQTGGAAGLEAAAAEDRREIVEGGPLVSAPPRDSAERRRQWLELRDDDPAE